MKRLILLLPLNSVLLSSCVSRRAVADRTEDRWDRRENRLDRRVYTGPGDVIEDRIDRREDVGDKLRPFSR